MNPGDMRCFKLTTDDWHPSFRLDFGLDFDRGVLLVEVSRLRLRSGAWRVCVWGADDTGMERDFTEPGYEPSMSLTVYHRLLGMDTISMQKLKEMGFKPS